MIKGADFFTNLGIIRIKQGYNFIRAERLQVIIFLLKKEYESLEVLLCLKTI